MITTRDIFVKLGIGRPKLKNLTTKDIDASIRITKPKGVPKKSQFITTGDVDNEEDRAERRKRLEIIAERKKKTVKKVVKEKKTKEEKIIEPMETITHPVAKPIMKPVTTAGEQEIKINKKPWKEMSTAERSIEGKRRAQVAKANKAKREKSVKKK